MHHLVLHLLHRVVAALGVHLRLVLIMHLVLSVGGMHSLRRVIIVVVHLPAKLVLLQEMVHLLHVLLVVGLEQVEMGVLLAVLVVMVVVVAGLRVLKRLLMWLHLFIFMILLIAMSFYI